MLQQRVRRGATPAPAALCRTWNRGTLRIWPAPPSLLGLSRSQGGVSLDLGVFPAARQFLKRRIQMPEGGVLVGEDVVAFRGAIVGVAEDRRHDADVLGVLLGDRASSGMPELMRADAPAECRLGDIPDFVRHGVRVDRLPHARNK